MKIGLSTYSLSGAIHKGEMTVLDAIDFTADNGGEHVEIVPIGFELTPELIGAIVDKAASRGIELSNYAIGANFQGLTDEDYQAEIERVKKQVDVAHALGIRFMRHDVASDSDLSIQNFNRSLDRLAAACREIADYAAGFGITTSVENHGYFIQASDRVQALVAAVDRANFRTTLDVGNFMCADENSVAAVRKNLPIASVVHVKDFYLRPSYRNPGEGWFTTASGNFLRGAVVGQGDIDMPEVIRTIKASGYDGYISVEFEGHEDCRFGSRVGMANVRRFWEES
ncbi:sugar phosphate isomerase/epimerase [Paenibacillus pasadenensis]|uniref:sugar phosphate isomerase/epimerase family protein n=1 Tax=Paenibacillus pasadenensis TaxID=217090 RepID=UPI00203E51D4|nr:sugar phosphate isomerase/epimerase family protein [Paenibacillus pasadenensis]MCM3748665.1 sugar phosphate isomerase/epimerase [Paenibacillus pasadenensis]